MKLMRETEQITVEGLHMLVQSAAATAGLLLNQGETEAVIWLAQQFQEIIVTSLKHLGVDVDKTLNVKISDN